MPEGKGWDLEVRISEHHLDHACRKCVPKYRALLAAEAFYGKVYDLLVELGGARPEQKDDFLVYFMTDRDLSEWRFQGKFGFGGKFWRSTRGHEVSCYPEDSTKERQDLMLTINQRVNALLAEFRPTVAP